MNRKWRVGHKHLDVQVQFLSRAVSELSKSKPTDMAKATQAKNHLQHLREKVLKITEAQETEW